MYLLVIESLQYSLESSTVLFIESLQYSLHSTTLMFNFKHMWPHYNYISHKDLVIHING